MMRRMLMLVVVGVLGCSTMGPIATDQEQAVLAAGDLGAACAGIGMAVEPGELAQARQAVAAVRAILTGDAIDTALLEAALTQANLPPQYRAVARRLVARLRLRLGTAVSFDKDSAEYRMVEAFLTECSDALGTVA